MQKCLMLGAGHTKPQRRLWSERSAQDDLTEWTTLDSNSDCHPDVVFDLERIESTGRLYRLLCLNRLPFRSGYFDEIHAYEVMEHYGRQGDCVGFFAGMAELWRVLKPGGVLFGMTPDSTSRWALGEPGHRRVISHETLTFLSKEHYEQLGRTASSDYRHLIEPCWWKVDVETKDGACVFALTKVI